MTDLSLNLVLKALDRGASPTVRKFRGEVSSLNKDVRAAPAGWVQLKGAVDKSTTAQKQFNEAGRQGSRTLDELIERQRRLRRHTDDSASSWVRFTRRVSSTPIGKWIAGGGLAGLAAGAGGLVGTAAVAVGGAAAFGAGSMTRQVISTGAQFESYQATLKTLSGGDVGAARSQMSWVQNFAKTTPYELDQVMEAFVRMRAYGIEPTDGSLKSLGNASSAMQKDLMAAVEMLADAQTGEFERLKEFGIRAKQQGETVTFTYTKAGKDIKVTSKKTASDIRRSLLGIFDGQFAGAMDEQSRTWNGMTSNLKDSWSNFLLKIAEGGAFDVAKGHLKKLLDFLASDEGQKKMEVWAKDISDSLTQLLDTMARMGKEVDWVGLARDVATLANAIASLASAIPRLRKAAEDSPFHNIIPEFKWLDEAPGKLGKSFMSYDWDNHRNPAAAAQRRAREAEAAKRPTAFIAGGNRPLPGLGGGPLQQAPRKGRLEIGLAPGLVLREADTTGLGFDSFRRGGVGDRP